LSEQSVVLAVAAYSSKAAAEQDARGVWDVGDDPCDHVAAVVEKGPDGKLRIDRHDIRAEHLAWGDVLLGSALIVVAPPLGIAFLAPVLAAGAKWGGVCAMVGHFWHNIPKADLRKMTDLLEDGQAAILVVVVDQVTDAVEGSADAVEGFLANAADKVVAVISRADLPNDLPNATDE
jgi:hypothetical protein